MATIHQLLTVFTATLFLGAHAAAGEAASGWVEQGAAKLRLVAGEPASDGLRAGLEIRLEPGWKTYWINPGPTGLPPKLDVSESDNVKSVEPLWPAPVRFDDGGQDSIGYSAHVVVPVRIVPENPDKPVRLKAVLDFGICEKICVPAHAELALDMDAATKRDAMAAIQIKGFEKRVPQLAKLSGEGPLAIAALARSEESLGVSVRFPDGAAVTDLFASSPDGPVSIPKKTGPGTYRLGLKGAPKRLELIAVADGQAIRVPIALDGNAGTP